MKTKEELLSEVAENELLKFLGVKVELISAERVVLTMEVTPKVHQYIGIMNGGVSLLLSETAASTGAVAAADLTKFAPVGIEINANHLRAVSKGVLTVEAKHSIPAVLSTSGRSRSRMTAVSSSVFPAAPFLFKNALRFQISHERSNHTMGKKHSCNSCNSWLNFVECTSLSEI